MTDRPIIFSAPMVLALLAGRKTMTRRLADQEQHYRMNGALEVRCKRSERTHSIIEPSPWQRVQPGDRLWVKETFVCYHTKEKVYLRGPKIDVEWVHYRASDGDAFVDEMKWESSMYMPRKLSRLTLIVTATKIERLQEISETDAKAEGMPREFRTVIADPRGFKNYSIPASHRGGFVNLWNKLHDEPHQWEDNLEVVVVSFTVHKQNIDALAKEAV